MFLSGHVVFHARPDGLRRPPKDVWAGGRRPTAPREVLMDRELVTRHEQTLLRAMASVGDCRNVLGRLDRQWTRATLTGKINCSRIAQTLIDFIIATQDNFAALQKNLVDTLVLENKIGRAHV